MPLKDSAAAKIGARPTPVPSRPGVVRAAMRSWRAARDNRVAVQPQLHALLAPWGLEMLAPAFDSMLSLGEACLGRPLTTGQAEAASADETMFCDWLADPRGLGAEAPAFASALQSASIMMRLATCDRRRLS